MSFQTHMKGYHELRTLYQIDRLYAWTHDLYFPPVLVEISPTNACNQACRYCYTFNRGRNTNRLHEDVFVSVFDQLADAGVNSVLLQGTGEPLLHPAVASAVRRGADRKLPIGLNTNGVMLRASLQEDMLRHLFYIKFSVIDNDPERYAWAHGCTQKQWEQLVGNIENAVRLRQVHGLHIGLWATVYLDERNFHEAHNIVNYYKEKGLDYIVIQEATYGEYAPAGTMKYASKGFSAAEIDEMKTKVLSLNDRDFAVKVRFPLIDDDVNYAGMTKETFRPNFCHGTKFYALISSDGEVYPCWRMWGKGKEFSFGSIYERTFEEIWRGEKRKRIEEYLNTTPPSGSECVVCNHARLNEVLHKCKHADSKWKEFII